MALMGFHMSMLKGDRKLLQSSNNANVKPNAVVAQDSGGRYRIAASALAAYLKNLVGRCVVVYAKLEYMMSILRVNVFR